MPASKHRRKGVKRPRQQISRPSPPTALSIQNHRDSLKKQRHALNYDFGASKLVGGYKNEHHLIEERVPPPSLIALRNELQLPRHRDIYDFAKQGTSFEDCIGKIAAALDIALDGVYDVPDLCQLLVKALQSRGEHGNKMHEIDPRLTSARLVERSDTLALEEGEGVIASPPIDEFSLKMRDWGCSVCNDKARCQQADRCLGVTVEEATTTVN